MANTFDYTSFTDEQRKLFDQAAALAPAESRVAGTINSSMLTQQPSANYQSQSLPTNYPISGLVQNPQLQPTGPENQATDLNKRLQELNTQNVGQAAYTAEQNQAQGVPQLVGQQNDLTSQIQALQLESQGLQNAYQYTIPNQMQEQATGRGITAAGLAPLTAGELRKNQIQQGAIATRALTTAATLAAVQGKLQTAQYYVDQAVKQKFDPIKEKIAVLTANLDLILKSPDYSLAEKNRAQAQKDIQDTRARNVERQEENYKTAQAMAIAAQKLNPNNQAASFAAGQVARLDPTSPDYLSRVFELVGQYQADPVALQRAIDDHNLSLAQQDNYAAQATATRAKTTADVEAATGKAGVSPETYNERQDTINLISSAMADPQFINAVGIRKINPLTLLPGTPEKGVKAQLSQIVAKLALDNRAKLKGSGAVSDFEARTLERAGSAFNTNLSPGAAKKALTQVRGVLTTMNGGATTVLVKKGNQTQTVTANTEQINAMIKDGFIIEYQ